MNFSLQNITPDNFEQTALKIFRFQSENNLVYKNYINALGIKTDCIDTASKIPFLPISFFKTHRVVSGEFLERLCFRSSGTTTAVKSCHYIKDPQIYQQSFLQGFQKEYGHPEKWTILALLPSYLERGDSSLVYMVKHLINASHSQQSGFYLDDFTALKNQITAIEKRGQQTLLIGVSFALLDFLERYDMSSLYHTTVMETGGMKGWRKEMIRADLHHRLKKGFGVANIHSEYGMTELLSQAYSAKNGIFTTPSWMRVVTRAMDDPLSLTAPKITGGLNIIDLANVHSCSFIATDDIGKTYPDGSFEVLGRLDSAEIRGCNLMAL